MKMHIYDYGWTLIYIAMGSQMIAQISRNQIVLRLLFLFGSAVAIVYYLIVPAEPLWGAMLANAGNGVAGIIGLYLVFRSRYFTFLTPEMKRISAMLPGLEPGELRQLLAVGEVFTSEKELTLTTEAETPEYISFVISGDVTFVKGGEAFHADLGIFVGEISYLMTTPASATATLGAGGQIIRWRQDKLRELLYRKTSLEKALNALLTKDMARKVASSVSHEPKPVTAA